MRTVTGPTERVVVIGAGLSGLAAALYLTGAGRQVTVLERADHVGGRVGRYRFDDYEIDSGATVLTLPELIDDALAAVGHDRASLASPLRIRKLAPSYHARFADGSDIRVFADPDEMAAEVARTCGPGEAQRYRGLREWLARIYRAEFGEFMDTNFDSPLDMVRLPGKRAALIELVRLGGFGRLGPRVRGFLRDPRLTRLFTFQALYAGLPPDRALAVYGAIPHMDTSLGVYFPEGGMRAVAEAMAQALVAAGGRLELGAEVTGIDYGGRRPRPHPLAGPWIPRLPLRRTTTYFGLLLAGLRVTTPELDIDSYLTPVGHPHRAAVAAGLAARILDAVEGGILPIEDVTEAVAWGRESLEL
uniref:phytoene desaturase family protein n=1 Tax=Nocardia cyriacigeorgica TaxID=135487 RepID=UPI002457E945